MIPLVISGPSGVGKSTLLKKLIQDFGTRFVFSVSSTTRTPRPGEESGKSYHFLSHSDFQAAVSRGEFLETAEVHQEWYGTHISQVSTVCASGKICILDIDVQGVQQLWTKQFLASYFFIEPKDFQLLEDRLRARGTDSEAKVQGRLKRAREEIEFMKTHRKKFTGVLQYDYLESAYPRFLSMLAQVYPLVGT